MDSKMTVEELLAHAKSKLRNVRPWDDDPDETADWLEVTTSVSASGEGLVRFSVFRDRSPFLMEIVHEGRAYGFGGDLVGVSFNRRMAADRRETVYQASGVPAAQAVLLIDSLLLSDTHPTAEEMRRLVETPPIPFVKEA